LPIENWEQVWYNGKERKEVAMNLEWIKCQGDVWCKLSTVFTLGLYFKDLEGVYIIWYEENGSPVTVRVGQGAIRDRLREHREDKEIQSYSHFGPLLVTWASVGEKDRDGVEAYLAQELEPKVGERFPDRKPIEVNLPW
jgi:hypothetical protein